MTIFDEMKRLNVPCSQKKQVIFNTTFTWNFQLKIEPTLSGKLFNIDEDKHHGLNLISCHLISILTLTSAWKLYGRRCNESQNKAGDTIS